MSLSASASSTKFFAPGSPRTPPLPFPPPAACRAFPTVMDDIKVCRSTAR